MKYPVAGKFIAILLAACALVAALVGVAGIGVVQELGLYREDPGRWLDTQVTSYANHIAMRLAARSATQSESNCSPELLDEFNPIYTYTDQAFTQYFDLGNADWGYQIRFGGQVIEEKAAGQGEGSHSATFYNITPEYPMEVTQPGEPYEMMCMTSDGVAHYLRMEEGPSYTVSVTLSPMALQNWGIPLSAVTTLYNARFAFLIPLVLGGLLFAVAMVYLCCAAGRSPSGGEPTPGGLNRLPLDLYAAGVTVWDFCLLAFGYMLLEHWNLEELFVPGAMVLTLGILLLAALPAVGFLFAVAAQGKLRGLYWWHHSVVGWLLDHIFRGLRLLGKTLCRFFSLLPLIWQWLLIGGVLGVGLMLASFIAVSEDNGFFLILAILIGIAAVCYSGCAFGSLLRGAEKMAQGDLNVKISTRYLIGPYRRGAVHLNALADVVTVAAQKQLRSERMKTELITNVSHDIKTPLTSIINYVDLLRSTDDPEKQAQYLEVLNRQSQRMKKLIEDLMEMSKATTGNMTVEVTQVDAVEAVNQALGEFSDKLAQAQLTPIFRQSAESVAMLADGRLTWRVLSNLLSNAVKYAQPGTRLYVDVMHIANQVLISLKNISREALNISADELTERFVRGDASRNTEGSGLGLNIAKSLMELQKGSLELLVDGDLFKVTLCFPAA